MKIEIKGFTTDQTAGFQKAFDDLSTELQDAVTEKIKGLAGIAALNSVKDLAEKSGTDFAELQKSVDELVLKVKNVEEYKPSAKVKSFADDLREQLTKEAAKFTAMRTNSTEAVKSLQLEVKTFLETDNGSVTTGSILPIYQYEPGISKAPDRMPFMMDLVSTAAANSLTIFYTQRKTRTDNSEWVNEGQAPANQTVLGYETKTAVMQNISAFIKASNNSIDDIEWLLSEIRTELMTLLMLKVDAALLNGTVAANGFDGVYTAAADFNAGGKTVAAGVTPNNYDVLKFAITQIKKANFRPNAIVLNPSDVLEMELTRDGNGAYLLPPFMQSIPGVGGIRIVENNGVPAGQYLVGDFTKAKFWVRKGLELKIFDQNENDAIAQLKTITAYMRGTLVVKDSDKAAFVKDTFAASIAEIKPA